MSDVLITLPVKTKLIYQKIQFYGRKNIKNLKSKQHKMSLFKLYYYYFDIKSFLHILTN